MMKSMMFMTVIMMMLMIIMMMKMVNMRAVMISASAHRAIVDKGEAASAAALSAP